MLCQFGKVHMVLYGIVWYCSVLFVKEWHCSVLFGRLWYGKVPVLFDTGRALVWFGSFFFT